MTDSLEAWMRPVRARFLLLIVAIACFLLRRPWGLNEVSKEEAQAHYKVLSSTSARSAATGQRGGLREASTATTTLEAEPPIVPVMDTGPTPAPTPVLRTYPDDPIMEQTWAEVNYNLTNAPTSMPATGLKYVKCRDHYKAFGGAWLAARSLVDKTSFPPHRDPEWSMHYMYGAHQHHGRKSLKTLDYRHFFVEHFTGLVHHIKEMDLESHPWATSMVRQRAQEAAALCDNLHSSPPFEHPHGDDEVAVVTFFWMKDQQEAFESNPHFYEIRSNYYRGTICAANRYFKTFKVFYCAERWPRSHFNGSDDGAIAESLLSARKTLRPGSTIEYIPVRCQADHYFPLIYAALGRTKELIKGDDAWPEQLKYILFTEPDQRVEIDQATAKENFDILDDTYYLSPHRLEELFVGKQVDGTFPQYRFDGRLFDTFNWCECKAWADSERFCLDYVGQHNG